MLGQPRFPSSVGSAFGHFPKRGRRLGGAGTHRPQESSVGHPLLRPSSTATTRSPSQVTPWWEQCGGPASNSAGMVVCDAVNGRTARTASRTSDRDVGIADLVRRSLPFRICFRTSGPAMVDGDMTAIPMSLYRTMQWPITAFRTFLDDALHR